MFDYAKRLVDEIFEHAWGWINFAICAVMIMFLVNEPEGWRRVAIWLVTVASGAAMTTRIAYWLAKRWWGGDAHYTPMYRLLVISLPFIGFAPVALAIVSGQILAEQPGVYLAVMVGAVLGVASNAFRKADGKNEKFAE